MLFILFVKVTTGILEVMLPCSITSQPIRGQDPGHVINLDQSEVKLPCSITSLHGCSYGKSAAKSLMGHFEFYALCSGILGSDSKQFVPFSFIIAHWRKLWVLMQILATTAILVAWFNSQSNVGRRYTQIQWLWTLSLRWLWEDPRSKVYNLYVKLCISDLW